MKKATIWYRVSVNGARVHLTVNENLNYFEKKTRFVVYNIELNNICAIEYFHLDLASEFSVFS